MKDYKELAMEIVYCEGYPAEAMIVAALNHDSVPLYSMLVAALNHMSQEDVRDMLAENELLPLEDEE